VQQANSWKPRPITTKPNQWVLTFMNQKVANSAINPSEQLQNVPMKLYQSAGTSSIKYMKETPVLTGIKRPSMKMTAARKLTFGAKRTPR